MEQNIKNEIEKFYPKLTKIGDSFFILVPKKEIVNMNGWEEGERLIVWLKKDTKELPTEQTSNNQNMEEVEEATSKCLQNLPTTKGENEHFFTTPRKLKTKME